MDDVRREIRELEARLAVLRRAVAEVEPDASTPESDAERRRRWYGGGDGLSKTGGDGQLGGLFMPSRGKTDGG